MSAAEHLVELPPVSPGLVRLVEPDEPTLVAAEAAVEEHDHDRALELLARVRLSPGRTPALAVRALCAEAWTRMERGELRRATELLERARAIADSPGCAELEQAEVLFRLGCCRLALGSAANAASLLTIALDLCDHSPRPCDRLRVRILDWRSRCYQRQRDWEAARADVECALELAESLGDDRTLAEIYGQASNVAEHERQWLLARCYAEKARERFARLGDPAALGKVLNNLGGINFLLGETERAVECLEQAVALGLEHDDPLVAGYATSSLAQVFLQEDEPARAEVAARRALELLGGRTDHLNEVGNAQLVLARSLLAQGRHDEADELCAAADEAFERLGSVGDRANAWLVRGDVARASGETEAALELYRRAAETSQNRFWGGF